MEHLFENTPKWKLDYLFENGGSTFYGHPEIVHMAWQVDIVWIGKFRGKGMESEAYNALYRKTLPIFLKA